MNPTTDVLEKRLAAMEGGIGAVAFSSGMAATDGAFDPVGLPQGQLAPSGADGDGHGCHQ